MIKQSNNNPDRSQESPFRPEQLQAVYDVGTSLVGVFLPNMEVAAQFHVSENEDKSVTVRYELKPALTV